MVSRLLDRNDQLHVNNKLHHIVIPNIGICILLNVPGAIAIECNHKTHINECYYRNQRDSVKARMPEGFLMLRLVLQLCTPRYDFTVKNMTPLVYKSILLGSSMYSLTLTRNWTASLPSSRR